MALQVLISRCQGKKSCLVRASTREFGDPCYSGTRKYLSVIYTCGEFRPSFCVHQAAALAHWWGILSPLYLNWTEIWGNVLSLSDCKACATNMAHAALWMQCLHLVIIELKIQCLNQPMPEPFTRSSISTFLLSCEETGVLLIVLNLFLHCIYGTKKNLMQLFIFNVQSHDSCEKVAPTNTIILKLLWCFTCVLCPWAIPDLSRL